MRRDRFRPWMGFTGLLTAIFGLWTVGSVLSGGFCSAPNCSLPITLDITFALAFLVGLGLTVYLVCLYRRTYLNPGPA